MGDPPRRRDVLLLVATLVLLHAAGVYHFCRGFLLTRHEIHRQARCSDGPTAPPHERCFHLPRPPRKVIWLIIDALRIDFAAPTSGAALFRNQLPFLHRPGVGAHLFLGWADPPTTTSQRLKALTTGGLPAFIEAGRNFDSDRILEDSLLHQLARHNKSAVVLGDDTWLALYDAAEFLRAAPFPSFDVWDLHSVDNGILSTLYDEVPRSDHQLLIAHFLGLDHAGHRFRADHPQLAQKLRQMNGVLERVYELMHPDDLLVVMGDHGMSAEGDHGGGTEDEVAAALFFLAKRPPTTAEWELARHFSAEGRRPLTAFRHSDGRPVPSVPQVDLVPTLAVLLGLPIPFSNLGQLIPEALLLCLLDPRGPSSADGRQALHDVVQALQANARQVAHYVHAYQAVAGTFPAPVLADLRDDFASAEADAAQALRTSPPLMEDLERLYGRYAQYLGRVAAVTRQLWTTFDLVAMGVGLGLLACTALAATVPPVVALRGGSHGLLGLGLAAAAFWHPLAALAVGGLVALRLAAALVAASRAGRWREGCPPLASAVDLPLAVLLGLRCAAVFSNSWIVAEDTAVHHLFVAAVALLLRRALRAAATPPGRLLAAFAVAVGCGRAGFATVIRRSLGTHVIDASAVFEVPLTAVAVGLMALWVTILGLHRAVPALAARSDLRQYAAACSVCCVAYWAQSSVHGLGGEHHDTVFAAAWARAVYALAALALTFGLVPLRYPAATPVERWARRLSLCGVVLLYPVVLVTGARYVHVFALWLWQGCAVAYLGRAAARPAPQQPAGLAQPGAPALVVFACTLLSSQLFFATGHQTVFNLVNFNAGFVGVLRYSLWPCGALTVLNTFGPHLLATIGCPAVVLAVEHSTHLTDPKRCTPGPPPAGVPDVVGGATRALLQFLAMVWLATLASALSVTLMRRHLMVWAIFTPKWCFDGVQSLC
eukprot:EG_transcript_2237